MKYILSFFALALSTPLAGHWSRDSRTSGNRIRFNFFFDQILDPRKLQTFDRPQISLKAVVS